MLVTVKKLRRGSERSAISAMTGVQLIHGT